jgi:TrmH family RNA methyltransferase
MVNMGFSDLILISPQCELDFDARQAAATAQEPLRKAQIFGSWDEFNQAHIQGLRLAFSTKDGRSRIVFPLMETLIDQKNKNQSLLQEPVYFVFGPEDCGLANEDISNCNLNVSIPTYGDNPSLNLAQAVLLGLFCYRQVFGGVVTDLRQRTKDSDFIESSDWFPSESLKKFLVSLRFEVEDRRVSVYTTLRQFLLRAVPTIKEKRLLQAVFEQSARKLNEYNEMREEDKA